ncbi:mechanosensitive ion channel family protein [Fodinicurvata fenggangensis]|uniref:mechanosensitive ion channel family protein n=1 Tax=Fodinicurvata fenggangensis TaxID=1121830 RepID=UPI00047A1DEA|nr:mechanosensitive ion channel domain-containing protein [Fodinicurvata fenggangensis]
MDALAAEYGPWAVLALNALKALVFLVIGFLIAGFAARFVKNSPKRNKRIEPMLAGFLAAIVYYLILVVVVIAVLQIFGFQATSLVAVLGAATLAIGFALQGSLANLAAGVMLILIRPFRIGDFVDLSGHLGTATDLNLFMTELTTVDNVKIVVPNGQVWNSAITNYSAYPTRRCDITFEIDYEADVDRAMEIILELTHQDSRFLKEPEPMVRVATLGESGIQLTFRGWTNAEDLWEARWALLKNVKQAFDQSGISIPYPHRVMIEKKV